MYTCIRQIMDNGFGEYLNSEISSHVPTQYAVVRADFFILNTNHLSVWQPCSNIASLSDRVV